MSRGFVIGSFLIGVALLLAAAGPRAQAQESKQLTVLRVSPAGEDVPAGRQIVIEFNRPVVPLGRMERRAEEVGVTIAPPLACQWRWLNSAALSCHLDEAGAMAPATRYELTIAPKIQAEDGAMLMQPATYSWITERPVVTYSSFHTWRGPGSPQIRVVFNQPVAKSAAEQALFMQAGAAVYSLSAAPDVYEQDTPDYVLPPGGKSWINLGGERRASDDDVRALGGEEARRVWIVEPREALPLDTNAALKIKPGLVSALGPLPGAEERDIVTFDTFPAFAFHGVSCTSNTGKDVLVKPGQPQSEADLCNPLRPVSLAFSVPVLRSQIKQHVTFTPDLAGGRADINPWGDEDRDWSRLQEPHKKGTLYYVGLPVGLKAAQKYSVSVPGGSIVKTMSAFFGRPVVAVEDEFSRRLATTVTVEFATNHRNPNFEIVHHDAVLEKGLDSDVPLYVNNLDSYAVTYRKVTTEKSDGEQTHSQPVTNVKDVQYAVPLGVRAMLEGRSGAVYGHLATTPAVPDKWAGEYRLFAQVTPWQVHLKLGHFSSLLWVTDMKTGHPVKGAKVKIYKGLYGDLGASSEILGKGSTDKMGISDLPGTSVLDPHQELLDHWQDDQPRLFLRIDQGQDMALLPIDSAYSLSTWELSQDGTSSWNRDRFGHLKSWGMTAQGVYRKGDTIDYKIWLRHQDDRRLVAPPEGLYTLQIIDPLDKKVAEIPAIKFSEFGAYAAQYKIPDAAPVGWYRFKLTADFTDGKGAQDLEEYGDPNAKGLYTLYPMRVLVSDFTPAPFKVSADINGDQFHPGDTMTVQSQALLHSGGAYGNAAARLTVTLEPQYFSSQHPLAQGFSFGNANITSDQIFQKSGMLDDQGGWSQDITLEERPVYFGTLRVEAAVQDDRGKSVAGFASAQYSGVDRFVGLKSTAWFYETKKPVSLQALVVDESGVPVEGTKISIAIEREDIVVAKVKGAGNAYLNDITRTWVAAASCESQSAQSSAQACEFTPDAAGSYRAMATIADTKGRVHTSEISFWVSGDDYVQWNDQDNYALSIIPEKSDYKVGDTASFLVKNPYPGAQALITVERYGVIDYFTKKLNDSAAVIELPIKPDYLPGFYLSVMVVSPRVEQPPPEFGQIDLGKPTFRLGYVTVPVRDEYKEIKVDVDVAETVYQPRDNVKVTLTAAPRFEPTAKEPIELAVAVLDESVFDLIQGGQKAFDPYAGFYDLDPLDMRNYSLLTKLVGRQKFEKKGANPGGDGGGDMDMRNVFKYVSYWNPSLKTDAQGTATVEFEAPDNLTGWRVLAVATTPGDLMGLGEGEFKVNRPTEIRPVMPNQVREEDSFKAGFSIMNRTDKSRTLDVAISASGDVNTEDSAQVKQTITLEPYKRHTVYIDLQAATLAVDAGTPQGTISFTARAGDQTDSDALEVSLPVLKKRVVDVAASYGWVASDKIAESIAVPPDIYTDIGGLKVTLAPTVLGQLRGAFAYMRDYPYFCWEQILTKGVMAGHYQQLKPWMPDDFTWPQSEDLPQTMLDMAANFQAPNGGMTYFMPEDERADPYLSAYTALAFGWLKKDGYKIPDAVETKLHDYLLHFLRQDAAPSFYDAGMISSVRAVALAALSNEQKITESDISRFQPFMKNMSLFGQAHFMQAALRFDGTKSDAADTLKEILNKAHESSGKFMFSETLDDGYARILATPLRDNCAVMSALVQYGGTDNDLIGDKPMKLARMITQTRKGRDHWENTQENIFCMNAIIDYARRYESETPAMDLHVSLGDQPLGKASFADYKDAPVTLEKPITEQDPGKKQALVFTREGQGRAYYQATLTTAPKSGWQEPVNAGMDIRREYSIRKSGSWVLLKDSDAVRKGDNVRVDLYLSLPAARNFVVVHDPLPGGLETVNRDLATASSVDDADAVYDQSGGAWWYKFSDWQEFNVSLWSFYHRELRHDSARFYADWLPAGHYHLSYMTQAIADGIFAAPPVRAEEMYDTDIYGRGQNAQLLIKSD